MKNYQAIFTFKYFIIILQLIKIIYGYEEFGQKLDYVSLPYREIKNVSCTSQDASFICDCHNINENLYLAPLDGNVFQVIAKNCESLTIGPYLLDNVQGLTSVTFQNIKELIIQENALAFRSIKNNRKLTFNQVKSIRINSHGINGHIEEITFQSSEIENIQPYGISTKTQTGIIRFDSMYIDIIERFAFKEFSLDQLIIRNTALTSNLPSKSFYRMKTQQLIIQNVTFREVYFDAFQFEEINNLVIDDNIFLKTNAEWLSAEIKNAILIENNNFGETSPKLFSGLHQHKDYTKSTKIDLRFNENIIYQNPMTNNPEDILPLEFDNKFNLMIRNLTYLNKFPCSIKNKLEPNSFYNIFSNTIYFLSDNENISNLRTIKNILETDCEEISYLGYIIGGSVTLILLLIVITIIIIWYLMKKRAAQKLNINEPESRTYEETQIVLKVENAGLLKTDL